MCHYQWFVFHIPCTLCCKSKFSTAKNQFSNANLNTTYNSDTYPKSTKGKTEVKGNFDTELQQNQKTLQKLMNIVGCRSNSV